MYIQQYPIIGIIGDRGTGKTLLMRYLASAYAETGLSIVGNFNMYDLFYRKAGMKGAMNHVDQLKDCVLFFDEIYNDADAKDYFSKNNKAITGFAAQTRKFHTTFIYSLQLFFTVDKRIRSFTDYFFQPEPYEGPDAKPGDLLVRVFNAKAGYGNDFVKELVVSCGKYYPLFDTDELIRTDDETWEDPGLKPPPNLPKEKNRKKNKKSP